jgi:hypothetical protein
MRRQEQSEKQHDRQGDSRILGGGCQGYAQQATQRQRAYQGYRPL